jgi:hypothetical protein
MRMLYMERLLGLGNCCVWVQEAGQVPLLLIVLLVQTSASDDQQRLRSHSGTLLLLLSEQPVYVLQIVWIELFSACTASIRLSRAAGFRVVPASEYPDNSNFLVHSN